MLKVKAATTHRWPVIYHAESESCNHSLLAGEGALEAGLAHAVLAHQHEARAEHGLRPLGARLVVRPHRLQAPRQDLPRGLVCTKKNIVFHTQLLIFLIF